MLAAFVMSRPSPRDAADPRGIVRQVTVNDLPVGRSVDEVLRLVKAFQFTDVHGEVCPAGWHPGSATMVADTKGSKAFFGAGHTEKGTK
jgi:alkyl hydroperoxide reductase subunit AhpC